MSKTTIAPSSWLGKHIEVVNQHREHFGKRGIVRMAYYDVHHRGYDYYARRGKPVIDSMMADSDDGCGSFVALSTDIKVLDD